MDLVAQHSSSEDHCFGSSLELFAHVQRLLKRGAPLVHVPRVQDLATRQRKSQVSANLAGGKQSGLRRIISHESHLAVRVDARVDEPLQYELGELVLQGRYCSVEGLGHLGHVRRDVGAEILKGRSTF